MVDEKQEVIGGPLQAGRIQRRDQRRPTAGPDHHASLHSCDSPKVREQRQSKEEVRGVIAGKADY